MTGISYGMVLFLVSTGVSIVFGLMNIVNLAHGMIFMTGAFAGITVTQLTGNFLLGLVISVIAAAILGLIIERGFLRTLYAKQLSQILVCFGFIYIVTNLHLLIYGPYPKVMMAPEILSGSIFIGRLQFSVYRLAVIIAGSVLCSVLYWVQERTKIGAIVRAGMENPEMVNSLGINLMRINIGAFFVGSCLSGFAGFVGVPIIGGITYSTGETLIFVAIAVCIVGGVGSIQGALVGALLIGVGTSLAQCYMPVLAHYIMYVLMVIVLIFRPVGIIYRK